MRKIAISLCIAAIVLDLGILTALAQDVPPPVVEVPVLKKEISCLPNFFPSGTGFGFHASIKNKYIWYWCPDVPGFRRWHVFAAPDLSWASIASRTVTVLNAADQLDASRKSLIRNYAESAAITESIRQAVIEKDADVAAGR